MQKNTHLIISTKDHFY